MLNEVKGDGATEQILFLPAVYQQGQKAKEI